ncbi:MAG: DUF1405 domain-containing protein [Candidatus Diapherotrites archaeon]
MISRTQTLFWAVFIANLAGAAYGFIFYYGSTLASSNPLLWIFIADCPLAALLFAIAIFLIHRGARAEWFYFLAAATALKYGIWTIFVLSYFPEFYFTPAAALIYVVLFAAHIGLIAEVSLLAGKLSIRPLLALPALAWLLLNDFLDYTLFIHPPIPQEELQFMFIATVAMTLFSVPLAYVLFSHVKKPFIDIFGARP